MSDTINIGDVIFHSAGGATDVGQWPATARITSIEFTPTDLTVRHTKEDSWPEVKPEGWAGGIQWTLWPVVKVNGQWHTTGCIEFWKGRQSVGGPFSRAALDWYYFIPEMGVQPFPGDVVGFFVTSGDERRKDVASVRERSDIVVLTVPKGEVGRFEFPADAPAQPPVPVPVPIPSAPPIGPPVAWVPTATKADLDAAEARITARIDAANAGILSGFARILPTVEFLERWFNVGKKK